MSNNDLTLSSSAVTVLMKTLLLSLGVLLLASCQQDQPTVQKTRYTKKTKDQRLADLGEMEAEMVRDPRTGEVPTGTLYKIRKAVQQASESRDDIEWIARGPSNIGGRTRTVLVDQRDSTGNTLWVGSVSGGLWKCENAQVDPQWTRIDQYLGSPSVTSIVQDPTDPDVMYVGTGEGWFNGDAYRGDGIYKSTDGGDSWERLPQTNDIRYVQKLLISTVGRIFACTRNSGILVSDNGGLTWTTSLGNAAQGFSDRAADIEEASNGDLFASMGIFTFDGIYRSVDSGVTWEFLDLPMLDLGIYERIDLSVAPSDSNVVLALLQDEESRACSHIIRSDDGGDTWRQLTVPGAIGMDNFARSQAWYDIISAIDPLDPNTMYIGGVDLHKTTDGGESWTQISQWFGSQVDYVHADQHELIFINNDPNKLLNTNDGGLWYTSEARQALPDFTDLSTGYVSTQFYSCAIHPGQGVNYFMGGTQDNGTDLVTAEGLGPAIEITGGDGAFCHIDQNEPDIQISAFQRGNYNVTTDGWNTSQQLSPGGDPFFINPTAYDSEENVLYAGYDEGEYVYYEIATLEPNFVTIPELLDGRISALAVDPSDSNILYLGTNLGTVVKVTNPRSPAPDVQIIQDNGPFTRCITVDRNNSDRLLISFSNFNVDNLLLTENGGSTWTVIDGNLPNIPVRWAVFNPINSDEIIIATEVGIWKSILPEPTTDALWENISGDIGTVRVDMLQFRNSDFKLLAATYGRGLYTTDQYAIPALQWAANSVSTEESIATTTSCSSSYILDLPVTLTQVVDQDVSGAVTISTNSTATTGTDFDPVKLDFFIAEGNLTDTIRLEIYDDLVPEEDKKIELVLDSDFETFGNNATVNISDDDLIFTSNGLSTELVLPAPGTAQSELPFYGFYEDARTQVYYPADYLAEIGVTTGDITGLEFIVSSKGSTQPYAGFTVRIVNSPTGLSDQFETIGDDNIYYSQSLSTTLGSVNISLDRPFFHDGSGILLEFCYDNSTWTDADEVLTVADDRPSSLISFTDGDVGCSLMFVVPPASVPLIGFEVRTEASLLADTERTFATTITGGETAYMSSGDSLLATVAADLTNEIDCISVSLAADERSFETVDALSVYGRLLSFETESSNNSYNITFWLPAITDSVNNSGYSIGYLPTWNGSFDNIQDDITMIPIDSIAIAAGTNTVTFTSVGTGVYFLTDLFVSTTDIDANSQAFDQIVYYDLAGRRIVLLDNIPTGIYIKSYMLKNRIVRSEKVLLGL